MKKGSKDELFLDFILSGNDFKITDINDMTPFICMSLSCRAIVVCLGKGALKEPKVTSVTQGIQDYL